MSQFWKQLLNVSWFFGFAVGILIALAPLSSKAQLPATCGSYQNWVTGQYYAAGSIVGYADGKLYRAKYNNPGYNPTISTYFWETYTCTSATTSMTCSGPNWVDGQYYASGAVVKYTDGKYYTAKVANPGYNPIISTYFWGSYTCTSATASVTCSGPDWVDGQYYASGAVVKYIDGKYYIAKAANPGYNPTVSTYFWGPQLCSITAVAPTPPPIAAATCNYPNWVDNQYYNAGAIVKYTDGRHYLAKFANPGYTPTVSTYFWESFPCSGSAAPAAPTSPALSPTASAGSAIPLPFRLVATYHPLWTGMRITEVPTSYNQIYLFHAVPIKDGSGRAIFEYGYVVNSADIATVRSRGQRVVLTFGGADNGFNFSNRSQSQNFVTSIIGIINSLGGQVDGLDFNNFEAQIGSSPTEMVWIAQQLKDKYGRNFSISAPPSPNGTWAPLDRILTKAMVDAGVMDYAGPQFYDHFSLIEPASIEGWIDEWVANFNGDASKVVVGFGSNYVQGSSLAQVQQTWTRLKVKYPNLRGAFGWSAETDKNAGWTFGNYIGNNK